MWWYLWVFSFRMSYEDSSSTLSLKALFTMIMLQVDTSSLRRFGNGSLLFVYTIAISSLRCSEVETN